MSNPYDPQNPQSQPSANPYEQPGQGGQYPPAGQQYPPAGQQYPPAGQQYPASQPSPYGQPADQQYPASQPSPYGQPPAQYGQQPYGVATGEHPQGTMIFVLGIVGIFVGVCAPIAWYLGNKALREVTASGANYSNVSQIRTGRMLGKVFTIIYIVFIVLYIIALIVIFGVAASQGVN
ncbi:MAG TPA: hypothetical protein VFH94_21520 [Streptomyces sp.]|nr:hypothetical protein [Streptomyces sp.]